MAQENKEGFIPEKCNNAQNDYANFDWPKFAPIVTRPLEICCLLIMWLIQWIHFQYRKFDTGSRRAWVMQRILSVWSIGSIILNAFLYLYTDYKAYPWGCAFCRPFILVC